ncbi:hypothetical protein BJ508DRAFT_381280 [Ascobolus immersus RN42]|uniref:Uncharacterized protein n=1 Tax=Ascobolus immersus RN42 TaxID=1160509 RepID=A0A3N4HFW4_ASCIM|nr:hypothetical protein BJ508DRAFT_381280 [Ascobolus immersus RN42]
MTSPPGNVNYWQGIIDLDLASPFGNQYNNHPSAYRIPSSIAEPWVYVHDLQGRRKSEAVIRLQPGTIISVPTNRTRMGGTEVSADEFEDVPEDEWNGLDRDMQFHNILVESSGWHGKLDVYGIKGLVARSYGRDEESTDTKVERMKAQGVYGTRIPLPSEHGQLIHPRFTPRLSTTYVGNVHSWLDIKRYVYVTIHEGECEIPRALPAGFRDGFLRVGAQTAAKQSHKPTTTTRQEEPTNMAEATVMNSACYGRYLNPKFDATATRNGPSRQPLETTTTNKPISASSPDVVRPTQLLPLRHFPLINSRKRNPYYHLNFNQIVQVPTQFVTGALEGEESDSDRIQRPTIQYYTLLLAGSLGWDSDNGRQIAVFSGYRIQRYTPSDSPTTGPRPAYEIPLPCSQPGYQLPTSLFQPPLQTKYISVEPEWLDIRAQYRVEIGVPKGFIRKYDVKPVEWEEIERLDAYRDRTFLGLEPVPSETSSDRRWMIAPERPVRPSPRTLDSADMVEKERQLDNFFEYSSVDEKTRRKQLEERVNAWSGGVFPGCWHRHGRAGGNVQKADGGLLVDGGLDPELEAASEAFFLAERAAEFVDLDWHGGLVAEKV